MSEPTNATATATLPETTPTTPAVLDVKTDTTDAAEVSTTEFNPAEIEEQFGLPTGTLKDCKDEDTAYSIIRDVTDKALQAGLDAETTATSTESTAPISTADVLAGNAAAEAGKKSPEVVALEKRLAELEQRDALRDQEVIQRTRQVVNERLDKEIDSWASPKYGVSGTRNYVQKKAYIAFKQQLYDDFAPGLNRAEGRIPVIEVVAKRLRSYDDPEGFDASRKTKKSDVVPLGTPGQPGKTDAKDAPSNIHAAFYDKGRFVKG